MATNSSKQPSKRTESTTQKIRSFFASEQKIHTSLNKYLVSKYFLVIFALSFIYSFRVEHGYPGYPTRLSGISDTDVIISLFEHDLRLHAML